MQANKNKFLTASVLPLVMGAALAAGSAIPLADVTFAAAPASASQGVNPTAMARGEQPRTPGAPARPAPLQLAACGPCGAKKKGCGACNPCGAKNACGACNPCGGGAAPELTAAEARKAYECLVKDLVAGYSKSGLKTAGSYKDWKNYSNQPYVSDTHGGRLVNNYGNTLAARYGKYEQAGRMPAGSLLAKDSFSVSANGKTGPGPLFLMEKMSMGFNKASGNWRYTMVMPNGQIFGATNGKNSGKMTFCYECHMAVAAEQDSLFFLPDEYRVR